MAKRIFLFVGGHSPGFLDVMVKLELKRVYLRVQGQGGDSGVTQACGVLKQVFIVHPYGSRYLALVKL